MTGEYVDLLKDIRWGIKRKKILTRDAFKCTVCSSKINLQVHHTYYYNQPTAPWAYPDDSLLTLCEKCHHDWHEWHELEFRDRPDKKGNSKYRKKKKYKPKKEKKPIDRYADLPRRLKKKRSPKRSIGKEGIQGAIKQELNRVLKPKK
jgi:hypothetical protein